MKIYLLAIALFISKLGICQNNEDYMSYSLDSLISLKDKQMNLRDDFYRSRKGYLMEIEADTFYYDNSGKHRCTSETLYKAKSISHQNDSVTRIIYKINLAIEEKKFNEKLNILLSIPVSDVRVNDAIRALYKCQWYYLLDKNRDIILPYVKNDYINNRFKRFMMIRLNPSKEVADSILQLDNSKVRIECRARLGDTAAEDTIIAQFNKYLNLNNLDLRYLVEVYGDYLLFAGTAKCLKAYISAWGCNKIYYQENSNYGLSYLIYFLYKYSDYYPIEYITFLININNHIYDSHLRPLGVRSFDVEVDFMRDVEMYAFEKYGIKLNIDLPFLDCDIVRAFEYLEDGVEINLPKKNIPKR
jgi:hypothetical protein